MGNRRISDQVKVAAMRLYERQGMSLQDILDAVQFSESTFWRVHKLWVEEGRVSKARSALRGRARSLHQEDRQYLVTLIRHRPAFFLDELTRLLQTNRLVSVHYTTVHRELQRARLSTKQLRKIAAERSPLLRSVFKNRMGQYTAEQLMFTDESSKDDRTEMRRRGRSLKGTRAEAHGVFVRGKRYSLIPVLTIDGVIAAKVVDGSLTRSKFIKFLEEHVVGAVCPY